MGDSGSSTSADRHTFASLHRIPRLPFEGKNEAWTSWKLKFTSWIKVIGAYDVMTGKTEPPSEDDSARAAYNITNSMAYTLIVTNVTDAAFNIVSQAPEDDGSKAWQLLLNRYETKTRAQKIRLLSELMRVKLDSATQDPEELFTNINDIVKHLSYWPTLRSIDEDWLIGITISALPAAYAELTTVLDSADKLTYDETKDKIRAFHNRRITKTTLIGFEGALFAGKKPLCSHCGKRGHKVDTCYLLHGKPPRWPATQSESSSGTWCSVHNTATHSNEECHTQRKKPRSVGF
eukprot:TRINITY_DN961_c0_g1_i1.p1 TRINITY_DN961_c0_g1~~TRINITY_DN961_c0_g1_i1.p1  ORF type:complete len:291 (+),score=52.92 TRINITY_DN961_c0_g1_i1:304-1176(+)